MSEIGFNKILEDIANKKKIKNMKKIVGVMFSNEKKVKNKTISYGKDKSMTMVVKSKEFCLICNKKRYCIITMEGNSKYVKTHIKCNKCKNEKTTIRNTEKEYEMISREFDNSIKDIEELANMKVEKLI